MEGAHAELTSEVGGREALEFRVEVEGRLLIFDQEGGFGNWRGKRKWRGLWTEIVAGGVTGNRGE